MWSQVTANILVIYMKTQSWYILDLQEHKRIYKKQVAQLFMVKWLRSTKKKLKGTLPNIS